MPFQFPPRPLEVEERIRVINEQLNGPTITCTDRLPSANPPSTNYGLFHDSGVAVVYIENTHIEGAKLHYGDDKGPVTNLLNSASLFVILSSLRKVKAMCDSESKQNVKVIVLTGRPCWRTHKALENTLIGISNSALGDVALAFKKSQPAEEMSRKSLISYHNVASMFSIGSVDVAPYVPFSYQGKESQQSTATIANPVFTPQVLLHESVKHIVGEQQKIFATGKEKDNNLVFRLEEYMQGMPPLSQELLFELIKCEIETCPVPVVAAINGITNGSALLLAMLCHYRVANTENAIIMGMPLDCQLLGTTGLPHNSTTVAVNGAISSSDNKSSMSYESLVDMLAHTVDVPTTMLAQLLARCVGLQNAINILCYGQVLGANEALHMKLVDDTSSSLLERLKDARKSSLLAKYFNNGHSEILRRQSGRSSVVLRVGEKVTRMFESDNLWYPGLLEGLQREALEISNNSIVTAAIFGFLMYDVHNKNVQCNTNNVYCRSPHRLLWKSCSGKSPPGWVTHKLLMSFTREVLASRYRIYTHCQMKLNSGALCVPRSFDAVLLNKEHWLQTIGSSPALSVLPQEPAKGKPKGSFFFCPAVYNRGSTSGPLVMLSILGDSTDSHFSKDVFEAKRKTVSFLLASGFFNNHLKNFLSSDLYIPVTHAATRMEASTLLNVFRVFNCRLGPVTETACFIRPDMRQKYMIERPVSLLIKTENGESKHGGYYMKGITIIFSILLRVARVSLQMLLEGALPVAVDTCLIKVFGFFVGIFNLMDLVGLEKFTSINDMIAQEDDATELFEDKAVSNEEHAEASNLAFLTEELTVTDAIKDNYGTLENKVNLLNSNENVIEVAKSIEVKRRLKCDAAVPFYKGELKSRGMGGYAYRYHVEEIPKRLISQGRSGHRCGKGFYNYGLLPRSANNDATCELTVHNINACHLHGTNEWRNPGNTKENCNSNTGPKLPQQYNRKPEYEWSVEKIIIQLSKEFDIKRRVLSDTEITDRIINAMINQVAQLMQSRILVPNNATVKEIDSISISAFGFPAFRGGLCYYADHLTLTSSSMNVKAYTNEIQETACSSNYGDHLRKKLEKEREKKYVSANSELTGLKLVCDKMMIYTETFGPNVSPEPCKFLKKMAERDLKFHDLS